MDIKLRLRQTIDGLAIGPLALTEAASTLCQDALSRIVELEQRLITLEVYGQRAKSARCAKTAVRASRHVERFRPARTRGTVPQ